MRKTLALVACLVLPLGLATSPTVLAQEELASASFGSGSIDWQVGAAYDRAVLTVAHPDGKVTRQEFAAGQTIQFDLGRGLDGGYRWELTLAPRLSNDAKAQLAAARGTSAEATVIAEMKRRGELPASPMIQSGSFQVQGGSIVPPGQAEPRPALNHTAAPATPRPGGPSLAVRDQVIPDDLIVQGSTCSGLDCVNNENFGFDTIRLKENNLRIHFDDTSTQVGFPANDWRLIANDSAGGGSSKFSIEDSTGARTPFTITAGASTNSIFADSIGRIGFRTSTPVLDLHINTSNTPAIRLEQNNTGGFTAQTWDIGANEANFFVRDVTGGSRLSFRIRPGAPTSSLDISSDGDVGIGTGGPDTSVDIVRSARAAEVQATTFSNDGALFSNMLLRRALGTSAAPLAVTTNSILGSFSFRGHTGSAFSTDNVARLEVRAEENFTATAQGTRIILQTTANGSATPSTRMVIKNDGSVGIGTASPTAGSRLEVNGGSIRVTGGSFIDDGTTLNVPDYVFEPDYKRMSLDELAAFVQVNKHLPNVPSQADIKKNGLNVSQFQMQLLEKVEELTLHTLDQHQIIQKLMARLEALEAQP